MAVRPPFGAKSSLTYKRPPIPIGGLVPFQGPVSPSGGLAFPQIGAHLLDNLFVRIAGRNDLGERLLRYSQLLKEALVGRSRIDVVADPIAEFCANLIRNPWKPRNSSHGQYTTSRTKLH